MEGPMARRSLAVREIAEILDHWQHGRSMTAIAVSLGLDRKTVRKYVGLVTGAGFARGQGPPDGWGRWLTQVHPELTAKGRFRPTASELVPLDTEIRQLLEQVKPTTAWRRLKKERRLSVSLASFRRYVRDVLPELVERAHITVRRPDPPPGEEAQVDYGFLGMWVDPFTGKRRAVQAFALILSHSRHIYSRAVFRMNQQAWAESHVAAFTFFQGAPRRIVPDNLKSGVLRPDLYDPRFNRSYEELAHHYGFLIDPARVGKPTDKPRIERQIPFIRADFWRGRSFSSLAQINGALEAWCLEVGERIHGTTREQPLTVFRLVEQPTLLPLPKTPFDLATWTQAKVARDCHIQVQGAWYSVPYRYRSRTVAVQVTSRLVRCYLNYELIKTHLRVAKGQRSTDWDDYPDEQSAFFRRTPDWCRRQARLLGVAVGEAVEQMLAVHAFHHLRQAQGVIRFHEKYGTRRLNAACARAIAFGDPSYRTIKTILERGLDEQTMDGVPVQERLVTDGFLRGPDELLAPLTEQGAR